MVLYHYTTPSGLYGILKEKSFWASDYRFLNDTSEFNYGIRILKRETIVYRDDIERAGTGAWLQLSSLMDSIDATSPVALVASFTANGDLLSQWRGYNNGRGFSIGINDDWLKQNAIKQGFRLVEVGYDASHQQRSAGAAAERLITMLEEISNDPIRVHEIVGIWWKQALVIALAFKDENFVEEHEYRLVYVGQGWPSGTQIRQSGNGLVPYLPCRFDVFQIKNAIFHPNNLGLEEIIVGPALGKHQGTAVDALLATHHMRFKISKSKIPYTAD